MAKFKYIGVIRNQNCSQIAQNKNPEEESLMKDTLQNNCWSYHHRDKRNKKCARLKETTENHHLNIEYQPWWALSSTQIRKSYFRDNWGKSEPES